jgi:hypothetical protein
VADMDLLQMVDAARMLKRSKTCVRDLVKRGELPTITTTRGQKLFLRRDVERVKAALDAASDARRDADLARAS